jgi:signal transduction histidine kinase
LGLYLAHSIAVAHGGALTVESMLGQGTTFQLAVPAATS